MKFGLFGSAQAQRGGPDLDSGQGFRDYIEYNVEAEALGYNSTFVVEHHFTGFGQVSASLNLLTWVAARTKTLRLGTAVMVLPWHNPVLLAEQAASIDLLVGRPARIRRRQGLPPQRVRELLHSDGGGRRALRGGPRADHQVLDLERALLAPRQVLALREHHRRAADGAEAASADLDGGRQPGFDPQGGAARLQADARPACLDALSIERFNIYKAEVEACGRHFDPMDVAVSRAFFVARNAEDKAKAIEARLANQTRLAKLAQTPDGNSKSSMLSFDQTLDAAAESAMFGTPDEIAEKLSRLRAAGVEHMLLNGPAGSRENLRAFARDVMPAFTGPAAEPAASRKQPQLATT